MEEVVKPMIALGMIAITEHRVIEKVRQRCDRPVQAAFHLGPIISVLQNQPHILGAGFQKTRISKDEEQIVQH